MKQVLYHPLERSPQPIALPVGSRILFAGKSFEGAFLAVEVPAEGNLEVRYFRLVVAGEELKDGWVYVDTIVSIDPLLGSSTYVFVYEVIEEGVDSE